MADPHFNYEPGEKQDYELAVASRETYNEGYREGYGDGYKRAAEWHKRRFENFKNLWDEERERHAKYRQICTLDLQKARRREYLWAAEEKGFRDAIALRDSRIADLEEEVKRLKARKAATRKTPPPRRSHG